MPRPKVRQTTEGRGREARLRSDFDYLYPGIEANAWFPVERLIHDVVTLLYGDKSQSGVITGERLLREDHFEFRGSSPRPVGLPANRTRMSDSGAHPGRDKQA
jgi:hypothetical protein